MPISPENRDRYPADWLAIRARILKRAGDKCERCGVPNHYFRWINDNGDEELTCIDPRPAASDEGAPDLARAVARIVLTIAHVHDPAPANCVDENLQALCQRCHNRLDAPMRHAHARETRRGRKAAGDLFQ